MRNLLIVLSLLCASGCGETREGERVVINGETFWLEVSADEASRTRGLMYRESIPDDGGMLFIFPDSAVRPFWMGNCLVDIDIIFVDGGGRVTAVHRMQAETPRRSDESDIAYRRRLRDYSSVYPATFAIELKAGTLDRLRVRVEDRIDLDTDRLKALAR
jgi:hypothetical protein